jgi:SAM-dependent methyltransferase
MMDVFHIPDDRALDVIIANAVNVYFEPDEYKAAIKGIFKALRPGGSFIAFEWAFPHNKEQRVVETSIGHPEGLKFWLRSENFIQRAFADVAFFSTLVLPFEIPIELPRPEIHRTDGDLRT